MSIFGKLLKTTLDVALLPVSVASDVVTLGGAVTDTPSAIGQHVEQIADDLGEVRDELDSL